MKKQCPDCRTAFSASAPWCDACGFQFVDQHEEKRSKRVTFWGLATLYSLAAVGGVIAANMPKLF